MIEFQRRKNRKGVDSKSWNKFSKLCNELIRSDGTISPRDLVRAIPNNEWLAKEFCISKEDALEDANLKTAAALIDSIAKDNHPLMVWDWKAKKRKAFEDLYSSMEDFNTQKFVRALKITISLATDEATREKLKALQ